MLNSVQLLRLIAALSVLFAHMPNWAMPRGNIANCGWDMVYCGSIGVDLFFCISGFLMVVTTEKRDPGLRTAAGFAVRRLFRIWPAYALVTIGFMTWLGAAIPDYLNSLLFWPRRMETGGFLDPALSAGWTLNFEMYFYALTALCLLLPFKTRAAAVIVVVLGCASLMIDNRFYFSPSIIVEFALGIGLGMLWMNRALWQRLVSWRWPILAASTAVVLFAAHGSDWPEAPGLSVPRMETLLYYVQVRIPRFIGWGVPAFFFALAVMLFEDRIPRRVAALGNYTYSIYLLHLPIIFYADTLGKSMRPELFAALVRHGIVPAAIVGVTLAGAFLVYHAVERPTQRIGGALARFLESAPGSTSIKAVS